MEKLRRELQTPRYELLPFKGAKIDDQWENIPHGATVTMTCSTKFGEDRTIERSEYLAASEKDLKVVPHLAARAIQSSDHLDEILSRLDDADIDSAFVVGGDAKDSPELPFHSSLELIEAIRERKTADELELGSTAYPDGHVEIDRETLKQDLLAKQHMIGYCATQLCFSPRKISHWVTEMQDSGLHIPIKVGIPGDIDRKKLLGIVKSVGISDSTGFLRKNFSLAKQFLIPGGYSPDRLVNKLNKNLEDDSSLIDGYHINTFNDIKSTENWRQNQLSKLDLD